MTGSNVYCFNNLSGTHLRSEEKTLKIASVQNINYYQLIISNNNNNV